MSERNLVDLVGHGEDLDSQDEGDVAGDVSDPDGVIEFSIDYLDLAGNFGSLVDSTTDESSVTFDRTLPEMTLIEIVSDNYYDSTLAMVADELTLIFTSSENIQAPPTVVIGDSVVSVSGFGT